jgi:hypothetical protein
MKTHTNTINIIKCTKIHKLQIICTLDLGECKIYKFLWFLRKTEVQFLNICHGSPKCKKVSILGLHLTFEQIRFISHVRVLYVLIMFKYSHVIFTDQIYFLWFLRKTEVQPKITLFNCYIKMWTYQRPFTVMLQAATWRIQYFQK